MFSLKDFFKKKPTQNSIFEDDSLIQKPKVEIPEPTKKELFDKVLEREYKRELSSKIMQELIELSVPEEDKETFNQEKECTDKYNELEKAGWSSEKILTKLKKEYPLVSWHMGSILYSEYNLRDLANALVEESLKGDQ